MKTTINKLLSIPLLVSALSAGTTQAASGNATFQALSVTPTNTGIISPNAVAPSVNILAVSRSLELRTKSLTTQVLFRPGITVAKPVTVKLEFSSPVSQYKPAAQVYDGRSGNRFVYSDPISGPVNTPGYAYWGKPRQMTVTVTLTDGGSTYSWPLGTTLDPLFDVAVTPLRFTLNNNCDRYGDSEIRFAYRRPDGQIAKKNFSTSKGKTVTLPEFAWSATEVSGSANVFWPAWSFYEDDMINTGAKLDGFGAPTKLLPGAGGYVGRTIKDQYGDCNANTAFDINVNLRTYSSL